MRPKRVRLGYSPSHRLLGHPECCFNEAQACPPGIFARRTEAVIACCMASMRPKRVRLGYSLSGWGSHISFLASMRPKRIRLGYSRQNRAGGHTGRRFNEAQTCQSGIWATTAAAAISWCCFNEAQACPPGIFPQGQGVQVIGVGASMRPGHLLPRNATLLTSCQRAEKSLRLVFMPEKPQ